MLHLNEAKLFTRCSLLVESHSLLVTRCKITRYSLQNSLVNCCRSCSLQKNYSLPVAKLACLLKKSVVTQCKKSFITLWNNHKSIKLGERFTFRALAVGFRDLDLVLDLELKNLKLFKVNILIWNVLLAEHFQTQLYTNG